MLSGRLVSGLGARLAGPARLLSTPALSHTARSALVAAPSPLREQRSSAAAAVAPPGGHGLFFKVEKLFPLAMLPLFPAGYFIHGGAIDYALAVAISLHAHWGIHIVIEDYARPLLLGPGLASVCHKAAYLISILLLAGLLSFNYNDVGITTGMQMIWSL